MASRIATSAFEGVEAQPEDLQVQTTGSSPCFAIIGLPDKAVGESGKRVRAAFASIGLALRPKRISVTLAPADLPKEGGHHDLALAMLSAMGVIAPDALDGRAAIAELGLDGALGARRGAPPAAMAAAPDAPNGSPIKALLRAGGEKEACQTRLKTAGSKTRSSPRRAMRSERR